MQRRNILKRIGAAGIVAAGAATGAASANQPDVEDLTITFSDGREDVSLSDCCYADNCSWCNCSCCFC